MAEIFADCNAACDGNPATPAGRSYEQCYRELDCWNSGYSGIDSRNQCVGPRGCQYRPLPLAEINDFLCQPLCTDSQGNLVEGPAGSNEECNAANLNSCAIVPPGENLCRQGRVFQDSCR